MAISMTVFDDAQKNYELRGENGVEAIYCTHIAKPGQFIFAIDSLCRQLVGSC